MNSKQQDVSEDDALQMEDDSESTTFIPPIVIPFETGLRIPFKQTTEFGCGSYALANLFLEDSFLNKIQDGERTIDLNKKLQEAGGELYVETLFLTSPKLKHDRLDDPAMFYIDPRDRDERAIRANLLIIFKPATNLFHYIALAHNLKNDLFYVLDSKDDHIKKFTLENLLEFYWIVGLEYFGTWESPDPSNEAVFDKTLFSHIIPEGE